MSSDARLNTASSIFVRNDGMRTYIYIVCREVVARMW